MPGEVTIRSEEVFWIVLVVLPAVRLIGVIVLPDQVVSLRSRPSGKQMSAIAILLLTRCLERRQHRFAHVHIGILPTVALDRRLVTRRDFIDIKIGAPFPESFLQKIIGFGCQRGHPFNARFRRHGTCQQDECMAVAMAGSILNSVGAKYPSIAAIVLTMAIP